MASNLNYQTVNICPEIPEHSKNKEKTRDIIIESKEETKNTTINYDVSDDANPTYPVGSYVRVWRKSARVWTEHVYRVDEVNKYDNTHKLSCSGRKVVGWYEYSSLQIQQIPDIQELKNEVKKSIDELKNNNVCIAVSIGLIIFLAIVVVVLLMKLSGKDTTCNL